MKNILPKLILKVIYHLLADRSRAECLSAAEESVELFESLGDVVEATSSLTWNLTICRITNS